MAKSVPPCYGLAVASDPSPEYLETLRKMDGVEKLKQAGRLFWSARRWKAAAIREKHPNWTEEEVQAEVSRFILHASD